MALLARRRRRFAPSRYAEPALAVAFALWVASSGAASGASATITLTDRATIAGPRVLLGSLARIDAADPELAERLDRVLVGLAPSPGLSRVLVRTEIEEALALSGVRPWNVEIRGAMHVELTRASQEIREGLLSEMLREAFSRETGHPESELEIAHVQYLDVPLVGGGPLRFEAEFLTRPELSRLVQARVVVLVDDVPSAHIDAELEVVRRAPMAVRAVAPASSSRPRGRPERLVKRGQQVTLELEGPGLQITATGKARSNGALGDEVEVENAISGIVVHGVVRGAGLVRVYWSPATGLDGVR